MCRKYVVGLPTKQEVERLCQQPVHQDLGHHLIPVVHRPSAVIKATRWVLFWPAGGLHNSVERDECICYDFSHIIIPSGPVPGTIPACTIRGANPGTYNSTPPIKKGRAARTVAAANPTENTRSEFSSHGAIFGPIYFRYSSPLTGNIVTTPLI